MHIYKKQLLLKYPLQERDANNYFIDSRFTDKHFADKNISPIDQSH